MKKLFLIFCLAVIHFIISAQSSSIERFRKLYKEDKNVFFYTSTIKMLNTENEPEIADLLKDIYKIMVLIYEWEKQKFDYREIMQLKKDLQKEKYLPLLIINEDNGSIDLYKKDRKNRTVGFTALATDQDNLVIIDVKGSIDFGKFMKFKEKIDLNF
ncbi:MAG: DUF4252 domain-containing protein [Bacteroidales bacterium]|nr:MAG: DUF4252 domain-containing protein [Bacteroidales bacterium]